MKKIYWRYKRAKVVSISCFLSISLLQFFLSSCTEKKPAGKGNEKLFSLLKPSETGVDFNNRIVQTLDEYILNFNYIFNGAGVAVADFDRDGLQDLYFTGNQVSDRIYRNKGNFQFEDLSSSAGIQGYGGWHSGVCIVDINNDEWPDIYVCRASYRDKGQNNRNLLFVNQGNLTFKEEAHKYGIDDPGYSMTALFFDMDRDNDLDLVVANRPDHWEIGIQEILSFKKQAYHDSLAKVTHQLYRNEGNGTFENITSSSGLFPSYSFALSLVNIDVNNDGFDDLFVGNDFIENDYLFINNGKGGFKESIREHFPHCSFYSMGADGGDIDNDGFEDLFVVEMRPEDYKRSKTSMPLMDVPFMDSLDALGFHRQYMHNMLHYNYGNGRFGDVSQMLGIDKTDWSWAALIADLDLDGWKDIFVTNGFRMDVYDRDGEEKVRMLSKENPEKAIRIDGPQNLFEFYPSVKLANYVYQNNQGFSFDKKTTDWGISEPSYSNGAALADLDNDGDLDIVINNIDEEAFIYRNNSSGGNVLRVKLEGPAHNKMGIGATGKIYTDGHMQTARLRSSRAYLSSSEPILHFGLGERKKVDQLEIVWSDGRISRYSDLKSGKLFTARYSDASPDLYKPVNISPLFAEATNQFLHPVFIHHENDFDDYRSQILLPHRMSRLGPFLAVADVNGDSREDFFVGGARGQSGAIFIQSEKGELGQSNQPALESDREFEDMGAAFFDADGDGDQDLYVVSGGTEKPEGKSYQDRLYINNGSGLFSRARTNVPATLSSGSCIAVSDFDGDGDLDIFRGGRTVPDRYPFSPTSYLFENNGKGKFSDISHTLPDQKLGMVTTAAWMNLDADDTKELVVTGEWMPVRIFKKEGDKWVDISVSMPGLQNTEGWWNNILATDLDGDGDEDLLAGNLGANYKFKASVENPFEVYCSDYDANGSYDIFLAKYNQKALVPVRGRQCASEQLPMIKEKFPSFRLFADASMEDILADKKNSGLHLQTKQFRSAILINNRSGFEIELLPPQAQIFPMQSVVVEDWDGDGRAEILAGGNLMQSEIETTRGDAGVGCLLKRDAEGKWQALPTILTGLNLFGDVKDIKMIHIGKKKAFLVSQNNGPLRLFIINGPQ